MIFFGFFKVQHANRGLKKYSINSRYLVRCPFSRSTREMTCWHDSSASSHVLHIRPFCRILSHELLANCTNLLLMLDSSRSEEHTSELQSRP